MKSGDVVVLEHTMYGSIDVWRVVLCCVGQLCAVGLGRDGTSIAMLFKPH